MVGLGLSIAPCWVTPVNERALSGLCTQQLKLLPHGTDQSIHVACRLRLKLALLLT